MKNELHVKEELKHTLTVEKDGREYSMVLPAQFPLGEGYDACHEFLAKILELAQRAAEKVKREESQANGAEKKTSEAK